MSLSLWLKVLALTLPLLAATPARAEVTVQDDLGHRVTLSEPAQRIVALAPHAVEMLYAAGAEDSLVGAVEHSDWPAEAQQLPRVGDYKSIDYERLLALNPDLVIAWESGNGPRMIERLRELGLRVYVSEPRAIEDIPRALERLGRLAGSSEQAERAAARFRRRLSALRERYAERPPVSTFYQVWNEPLVTINGEHLISQVIELCGGRNVFAGLASLAPAIGVEAVLQRDPEAIIASGMGEERPEWLDGWQRWPGLTAVREDNLYFVPPYLIQRHSPRILDGAELVCEHLQEARQ